MSEPSYDDAAVEAAVSRLSEPGRFREAESVIARAAPGLQKILTAALAEGGWFSESHDDEVRKAASAEVGDAERLVAVRTLIAEEARMGMMVGVAVGWALAEELKNPSPTTEEPTE